MNSEDALRKAIASAVSTETKAHSLAEKCGRLGLEGGDESEPWANKYKYVERRIADKQLPELCAIAEKILGRRSRAPWQDSHALQRSR